MTTTNAKRETYKGTWPKCGKCNYHHLGECSSIECYKCGMIGHYARNCGATSGSANQKPRPQPLRQQPIQQNQPIANRRTCFECDITEHLKWNCPKLIQGLAKRSNQVQASNSNPARGRVFVIGSNEARQVPDVITGLVFLHKPDKHMIGWDHKPGVLKWVEIKDEHDHQRLCHDPVMSLDLFRAPVLQSAKLLPVGSVNGLVCLWEFGPKCDNTYICNSITREYMILPRQRYYRESHANIVYGFGISLHTLEYKVLRIFQGDNLSEAEVYTLGTSQWRSLGNVPYWLTGYSGSFLNGKAHWTCCNEDATERICTFDFEKETFQLFPSPPLDIIANRVHFQSLAVLNGCLSQSDTYDFNQFTIWVMKEYGIKESWHKEVVIKEDISPDLDWVMWEPVYLQEGLQDGSIFMIYYEDFLLKYCPKTKTIEKVEIFDRYFWGLAYRPSFLKLQSFELESVHVF